MYFPLDQDLNDTLLVIISRFCEYCWFLLLETATLLWLWTNFALSLQERALLSFSPWHFLWNSFPWVSPGPFLFLLKLTVLGTSQLGNCSRTGKPVKKQTKMFSVVYKLFTQNSCEPRGWRPPSPRPDDYYFNQVNIFMEPNVKLNNWKQCTTVTSILKLMNTIFAS